ncbi:MAG: DNA-directed RNA polymerase subunit omega [bacterium]
MLSPELEKLLEKVGKNKYKLVVIAAKMAHQIEQEGKITDVKPLTLALKKLIEESKTENKSSA